MKLERGDILRFSEEGLDWLYANNPKRGKASQWRFEYRCQARKDIDCISVIKVGTRGNRVYHRSFLEKVD